MRLYLAGEFALCALVFQLLVAYHLAGFLLDLPPTSFMWPLTWSLLIISCSSAIDLNPPANDRTLPAIG